MGVVVESSLVDAGCDLLACRSPVLCCGCSGFEGEEVEQVRLQTLL